MATSRPISLTDDEMASVLRAAIPLPVEVRDAFLQAVARRLGGQPVIGPGVVFQVCRELQAQFFDPPDLSGVGHKGPQSRRRVVA